MGDGQVTFVLADSFFILGKKFYLAIQQLKNKTKGGFHVRP